MMLVSLAPHSWDCRNSMKLLIKQRVFSWTDTYDVYDYMGEPKYYVKAEFFSFGHSLHIYRHDTDEEIGHIKEKIFTFLPAAEIYVGGSFLGTIRKEFTFFVPKYTIDYNGWDIEGDFLGWEYEVRSPRGTVASISKQLFRFGDTYEIDIEDPSDELDALLTVITIDMMNCSNDD